MQEKNQIKQLAEPLEQQLPRIWQHLAYYSNEQASQYLTLCVPANLTGQKQPHYPVILFAPDHATNRLSALLQLTRKGYAIAVIDKVEKRPLESFYSAARFLMLHAFKYQLDPNRIIAMGEGVGAYAATGAAFGTNEQKIQQEDIHTLPVRFRSCITIAGRFILADQPQLTDLLGKRNLPPFLLLHGTADQVEDIKASQQLFDFLNRQEASVNFYKLQDCPHGSDAFFTPYMVDILADFIASSVKKGK